MNTGESAKNRRGEFGDVGLCETTPVCLNSYGQCGVPTALRGNYAPPVTNNIVQGMHTRRTSGVSAAFGPNGPLLFGEGGGASAVVSDGYGRIDQELFAPREDSNANNGQIVWAEPRPGAAVSASLATGFTAPFGADNALPNRMWEQETFSDILPQDSLHIGLIQGATFQNTPGLNLNAPFSSQDSTLSTYSNPFEYDLHEYHGTPQSTAPQFRQESASSAYNFNAGIINHFLNPESEITGTNFPAIQGLSPQPFTPPFSQESASSEYNLNEGNLNCLMTPENGIGWRNFSGSQNVSPQLQYTNTPTSTPSPSAASPNSQPVTPHRSSSSAALYFCSRCGQSCKRQADLKRHTKNHSPEKDFPCLEPGCERQGTKGFRRKDKMMDHYKVHRH